MTSPEVQSAVTSKARRDPGRASFYPSQVRGGGGGEEDLLAGTSGLKIVVSYLQVSTLRIVGTKTVFSYNL